MSGKPVPPPDRFLKESCTLQKEAQILVMYDGWQIRCNGNDYFYDHDDEMYGAKALEAMLKDLGFKVTIEEVC